ncbi:MAG: DUF4340 domain-containing protein [Gemmatimonadota bacterium]|nr:DUF4340 domain-containing protein [Gemmatimonadota bacterium]MDE3171830.1 DUF4340 domain-containing protein [Gemmatimonadota bacterium]MDE3216181.1 DUF4340 domain-containing protein [Gemmatimonadota bacterium]
MNNKQLVRLAMVLAAVVVVWGVLALTRRSTGDRVIRLAIAPVDTAAVDTVAFTKGGDTALLVRDGNHRWRDDAYPATQSNVAQLLSALADTSANSTELVAENRSAQPSLGVTPDSGQRVRVIAGGRVVMDWTTGHQTADYAGLYVRPTAGDRVYSLHGTLAGAFGHGLVEWRDHTIVALPADSIRRIEVRHGREAYALVRGSTGAWSLAGAGPADSIAAMALVNHLNPLSAEGFASTAEAKAAQFAHPTARVRVFGTGASPLADVLFDSTASAVWARADTGTTVYQVETWNMQGVTPGEKSLRPNAPKPR